VDPRLAIKAWEIDFFNASREFVSPAAPLQLTHPDPPRLLPLKNQKLENKQCVLYGLRRY
jgi:hypothetical protein